MIGRKLISIKNGHSEVQMEVPFEIPYLKETKDLIVENIKKYEHLSLIVVVKSYLQLTNFLKNKYGEVKNKIQNRNKKNIANNITSEKAEVSRFLKIISDYKHKIKEIKHKIKEEEKN